MRAQARVVSIVLCLISGVASVCAPAAASPPRIAEAAGPERLRAPPVIYVKFQDELRFRIVDGRLEQLGGVVGVAAPAAALDTLPIAAWRRVHDAPEGDLDALRVRAEANLGRKLPDLNTEYFALPLDEADAQAVIDSLDALAIVEMATCMPRPAPPPVPPNFELNQGYLNASPTGVDARYAWSSSPGLGTRGEGIGIADIEYTFRATHADLPPVLVIGPTPVDPGFGPEHGTAVLGMVAARNNSWGVTGAAAAAEHYFVGTWDGTVWNVGGAIVTAALFLREGDVILVEQQMAGPRSTGGDFGSVPIEWFQPWYNSVVFAVANGMVVVLAGGNGSQNLDDVIYRQGNGGHWPFLASQASGAIYVGAGAAASGFGNSTTPRSRLGFSNYGSRMNVQGWGEGVWTTGYGSAYTAEGPNQYYSSGFGGTSSATAMVAGACALLQSAYKEQFAGAVLSPQALRDVLITTGAAQQSGMFPASQHIGPLPDIRQAAAVVLNCPGDWNLDGVRDTADFFEFFADFFATPPAADYNGDGATDTADFFEFFADFFGPPCI